MRAAISLHQKIVILRGLEQYAYQIAHYILQDEALAAKAAKSALIEISQEEALLEETAEKLRVRTKKLTIRASLVSNAAI
ncbi:hypothetical protein BK133_23270 [Paenibacillus sp. FSL H8-0548]|uniref:hypothetical protein n=1 Tax=Paenibacillus sp. FSL H8-0548 TaxID=1920422 RepID=UPI00096D3E4A|nr:hypothetical protein [Paenibacillus sp. FSL H8-0548]OMF24141.1 hypothetical protein BK133_23270 [Paenibacillus sp. FSL H8-0548]